MPHHLIRPLLSRPSILYAGPGYLAGEAPADPGDPDSPDGRTKILGVLGRVRVTVVERSTLVPIAETVSAADGTWRLDNISPVVSVAVMFFNDPPALVLVDGEMRPINGFMQDWIHAEPYGP